MGSKFKPLACGFHSHTDVGSLDGGSTPGVKIKRADELGRIADCVTDHGTMNALADHWTQAEKLYKSGKLSQEVKSIHGIEAYVVDFIRGPKVKKNGKEENQYFHLTIHFKTAEAYKYFCSLTPKMEERAIKKFGESKPLLFFEELEPIAGQITLGTGCLVGMVQKWINNWDMTKEQRVETAVRCYEQLRSLAGKDNFFVEVFPHAVDTNWKAPVFDKKDRSRMIEKGHWVPIVEGNHVCDQACQGIPHIQDECGHDTIHVDIQKSANKFVLEMAKKYGDPVVISEDSHFAEYDDHVVQEVRLGNGQEKWKFYTKYYMGDSDTWAENLKAYLDVTDRDIEEWIDNSYLFVDQFKDYSLETADDRLLLPDMNMVYGQEGDTVEHLHNLIDKYGLMPSEDDPQYQVYKDRLEKEIEVLARNPKADFLPYFFVLEDATSYARQNDIAFNTRGSAGGSLILYLIGVSITDPIKYGLPFERFLTLGRIKSGTLPDVDTDWDDKDRILEYLRERYGDKCALISTNQLMRFKNSARDVERAQYGYVSDKTEEIFKKIPAAPQGMADKDFLFGYTDKTTGVYHPGYLENEEDPVVQQVKQWGEDNPEMWETLLKCIGITRSKSVHAGGVILAPDSVHKFFPLISTKKGLATAYTMKPVEALGGVKYDFLTVDMLEALGIAAKSIRERLGIDYTWSEYPHDDKVYEDVIHKDALAAIFQLNTNTVRPYVKKINPRSVKEIAITTALIRPGALDAPSPDPNDPENVTAADYFIMCRQGEKQPYYIHPDLEPILSDTYGVIVFQEQPLEIFRELANYSYEEAEAVRRGIGKKNHELLSKHGAILKEKLAERGWTKDQADRLYDSIIASARYSFNKSHATSYAIVAYNGCYFKRHYPLDFWKGVLTIASQKEEKLKQYMQECTVDILPVDAQESHATEWRIEEGYLRPPMNLVKGCGIVNVHKMRDFIDELKMG